MKPKHSYLIAVVCIALSLIVSGCYRYRSEIPLDPKRAGEQVIPIEQARNYQSKFISSREALAKLVPDTSFLKKSFNLPNAESFNRDMIALLLNQKGADGIRIYYGQDDNGQIKLVLLPVDKEGHDIITTLVSNTTAISIPGISHAYAEGSGQAGENGQNCPPCSIH